MKMAPSSIQVKKTDNILSVTVPANRSGDILVFLISCVGVGGAVGSLALVFDGCTFHCSILVGLMVVTSLLLLQFRASQFKEESIILTSSMIKIVKTLRDGRRIQHREIPIVSVV